MYRLSGDGGLVAIVVVLVTEETLVVAAVCVTLEGVVVACVAAVAIVGRVGVAW